MADAADGADGMFCTRAHADQSPRKAQKAASVRVYGKTRLKLPLLNSITRLAPKRVASTLPCQFRQGPADRERVITLSLGRPYSLRRKNTETNGVPFVGIHLKPHPHGTAHDVAHSKSLPDNMSKTTGSDGNICEAAPRCL